MQGVYREYLLVGDSGYAQTPFMMIPLNSVNSQNQSLYNESQIRTRNVIERTFGVWKRRFPILSREIQVHLCRIPGIIIATSVLHNIAQQHEDSEPPLDLDYSVIVDADDDNHALGAMTNTNTTGFRAREVLIEQHFGHL